MIHVRIGADVHCIDGKYGTLDTVIADRTTRRITLLGVERSGRGSDVRLVPVDRVFEGSTERITLNCSSDDLAAMDPYLETTYTMNTELGAGTSAPVVSTTVRDNLPNDSKPLRQGMRVEADDGPVGKAYEVIIDSSTGEITHFSLVDGRLWRKKAITLPLSDVLRVSGDTIYLKLDKQAVGEKPYVTLAELDRQAVEDQYADVTARLTRLENEWMTGDQEAKTRTGHAIERLRLKREALRDQLQ